MSIIEFVFIFLIGGLIGYLIGLTCWLMEISKEITMLNIELARVKAEWEALNENN